MSIEFDWNKLVDDGELAEKVRSFLDNQFKQLTLPSYISSLSVTSFDFGTVAPDVTIKHITDPFPEFYEEPSTPEPLPTYEEPAPAGLHYFHPSPSDIISSMRSPIYASLFQSQRNRNQQPKPGREDDTQFFLEVNYKGDMQLGVCATLLLNYPSPSFVTLPLKLTVTGLEISSMAVLAYISRAVHFAFICDIGDEGDAVTQIGDRINIIKDIKIESEIGDQEGTGPVLRNVGKVERFLLDRLRALVRDEVAWPGWITFEF